MKNCLVAFFVAVLLPLPLLGQSLTGFAPGRAEAQLECEAQLREGPTPEAFRGHLERLTRDPHPTGSAANEAVADYLARVMEEAGLAVERYPYDAYLPQLSTESEVALVRPLRMPLNNQEYIHEEDRFSDHPDLMPGWNAFSGEGDVTAEVIYANYGRKEDFEKLEALGVPVEGKIVVARYGGNFRGYKVKYAEEHGAAGVILYSDPADGGYASGLPYPEGRYLSESTIQRGSVLTLGYWGDPLTPFEPALPEEKGPVDRLAPGEVEGLHTIPVAPLPHASAREILSRMEGAAVPEGWQGGLPFAYRLTGGSRLTMRLRVEQPKALTRIANVVGTLPGSEYPDEWIVLGAHYDAWAFGAVDPNGGTAMLLTLAEALGALAETGCRPRRSIKVAHWDAEEYGIIGSTEWVEELREELTAGAVAYLNADAAISGGRFSSAASPSLKGPILAATKAVAYPDTGATVFEKWKEAAPDEADEPPLGNLGGGSDHVGFYTHLGIPSAGLSMSSPSPVYHSNYDNFAWYERFADTSFVFGPALARVDGVLALRLANADLLPYDLARYAADLETHVAALEERADALDVQADLQELKTAVDEMGEAAAAFEEARDQAVAGEALAADLRARVNQQLIALERGWLHEEGLQGRPWSRSLYAGPDPFSGYAAWMLPGLRYEVETAAAAGVRRWAAVYAETVRSLSRQISALTAELNE